MTQTAEHHGERKIRTASLIEDRSTCVIHRCRGLGVGAFVIGLSQISSFFSDTYYIDEVNTFLLRGIK